MTLTVRLKLEAQRALLGAIVPNVRAVSASIDESVVRWRVYFASTPTDEDLELMQVASTEVIAGFSSHTIDEEYLTEPPPGRMEHLGVLVYLRHEQPT